MRQTLFKNQKKSKLYIYPKTSVITLLPLERSEALSRARIKTPVRHLERGATKQSKNRDCFTDFTLSMENMFAMTTRECHREGQSPEAISYI